MTPRMMFLALGNGSALLIEGESLDEAHLNEIVVLDWDWGLTNVAPIALKESDDTKSAHVNPLTINKVFDKASPALAKYCALGKHIPKGKFTLRKHGGHLPEPGKIDNSGDMREFLTIELEDIKITSVGWGAKGGEDERGIPETVILTFLKCKITYKKQDNSGQLTEGPSIFNFDVGQHKLL
jgi:type VI secretion system secreted protein Hcp